MKRNLNVFKQNINDLRVLVFLVIQAYCYVAAFLLDSIVKTIFKNSTNTKNIKITFITIFFLSIPTAFMILNPILNEHYNVEFNKERILAPISISFAIYILSKLFTDIIRRSFEYNVRKCPAFMVIYLLLVAISSVYFRSYDFLIKINK